MTDDATEANDNQRLTLKLLGFALGSFAFGFALVPLYDVLCDITGFGNQQALAEARVAVEQPDDSRTITIDFVTDLPSVGNWEFRPDRGIDAGASRPALRDGIHRAQPHRPRHHGAGRAQHRARQGRGVFPQDRVLLLHAAEIRGRTSSGPWPCASWSIRRCRARSTASLFPTLSMTSSREWAH